MRVRSATGLTTRQEKVLRFIADFISRHGYAPSLREIARHFGMKGTRGVERHLQALERKGRIRKTPGLARALEVVANGGGERKAGRAVPIVGNVAAGRPILAVENIEGTMLLDSAIAPWEGAFLLRVQGESMRDAGIRDGDLVLVKPQKTAEKGEIVVAIVDSASGGEATVKHFFPEGEKIRLVSANSAFLPIVVAENQGDFQLLGTVAAVLRVGTQKKMHITTQGSNDN